MQPKKYTNPKIALLNVELELKAEKENAEIRVDNVEVNVLYYIFLTQKVEFNYITLMVVVFIWGI